MLVKVPDKIHLRRPFVVIAIPKPKIRVASLGFFRKRGDVDVLSPGGLCHLTKKGFQRGIEAFLASVPRCRHFGKALEVLLKERFLIHAHPRFLVDCNKSEWRGQ